jgi:hypothetical protein
VSVFWGRWGIISLRDYINIKMQSIKRIFYFWVVERVYMEEVVKFGGGDEYFDYDDVVSQDVRRGVVPTMGHEGKGVKFLAI